ncbi:MAG: biosynthetic-type acetolactate synthase large subunit [Candidatus Brocadiae bacterium]|nr:biosynthetic-type acetolactate synthase large subunit [Candidatus Brocadiia bacterium]
MSKTGAQLFVDALVAEGVKHIFGIPGGVVIPIFDALYDSPLHVILTRHEQGAGHMADGYARASGDVGVCIATSGPGATNLATAIATANFDSVPVVAFTGQVRTNLIGNDAFQEADITGITRPITKHNFLVKRIEDLGHTIRAAFHIARTGRPGPVLVDLPQDVSTATTDLPLPDEVDLPGYKPNVQGNVRQIRLAAEAINRAQRPLLYVGGGVIIAEASAELRQLAEAGGLPVTTTLMGLGAFPEDHPLALGMLGMHGTAYANFAMQHADCIVAIGARFDDRITGKLDEFAPQRECIVHIDIDPSSIAKNVPVDIPVVGDARRILRELVPLVQPAERAGWHAALDDWKAKHPLAYDQTDGTLKPQFVIEQIHAVTKGEAIITTEVGQNQMWAAQWYTYTRPRSFLTSGGLGTMGYGFPAAIGAQVACPDRVVFDIAGDGSIQMNIQELSTAVQQKLPVKVAILNNGFLGMVRQWQEMFFNRRYACTRLAEGNPDFVKLAEAYGAKGIRVEHADQVRPALDEALAYDGPVMLDFRINPEENVFPMVPAGEAIHRMRGLA